MSDRKWTWSDVPEPTYWNEDDDPEKGCTWELPDVEITAEWYGGTRYHAAVLCVDRPVPEGAPRRALHRDVMTHNCLPSAHDAREEIPRMLQRVPEMVALVAKTRAAGEQKEAG